ncbi:TolC family protein [candidate division KSB1 bacterium]|nr:TolC family protein [candidate division KSB1 bacterium]RQW05510.1 MAG: TolC family protein [candidate division KSB1 bacterium]
MKKACILVLLWVSAGLAQTTLSMEDALNIAMQNSPQIKQAELSLERSRQSLKAQRAALKSNFSLSINPYNYSYDRRYDRFRNIWYSSENTSSSADFRIRQPILWTDGTFSIINRLQWLQGWSEGGTDQNEPWSNNLYLNYEQPVFTYNRTKLALNELELDLENTMINYVVQKLSLEYDVTNSFYEIYRNKLAYDIAREEYVNTNSSYQIIKNKVDAGIAAKEEFYQAELNLLNSESAVQNNLVQLENSLDSFKKLIGVPISDSINIVGDVTHIVIDVDLEKAINNGLKNRLELRQREIEVQSAYHNLIETMALNEFQGSISLTYGIQGVNRTFESIYDNPDRNRQASISFEIPLFDWGERKARIKASEATIESRKLSQEEEQDNIIISIRQAHRQLQNLVNQIEIARQNVKNAELTYEINLERYKNGDLTGMDLNLYQIQLSDAKIQLTDSIINYKLALLNLKILSMYDFIRNEPVVPENLLQEKTD